jgi:hypothetical protein
MNLTSVANAKAYLGITSSGSDAVIGQLIARASDQAIRWCSRPFQRNSYTNARYNGTGSRTLRLPDTPIITVSKLTICSTEIPVSADGVAYGYQFDEFNVFLFGALFPMSIRNIGVDYVAGFSTTETDFVPAANGPYTIAPTAGGYAAVDRGVANSTSGAAYTLVGSSPAAGQYSFAAGVYTFNATNTGNSVTMSYDYTPASVEQAVIEIVGTTLKARDNLGITSKGLRDEHISYADKAMSAQVEGLLWPYRKVVPV